MATIVTKNSSTASAVPTTSDLVQGELAVNVTDKRIFTENASTQIVELGTNPSSITTATATVTGTLTANGTFASSNAVITGGSINSTPIGATTPSTIVGSTVTANTGFVGGLTGNVTGNLTGNVTGNVNGNLTGNVTGNVTASSGTTTLNDLVVNGTADFTNTKLTNITTPTVGTDAANKSYVDDTVAAVIDSAPAALDTLNELAAALGDDANFAGTVTTALATKLPLAGGTMTGAIAMGTSKITGLGNPTSAQDAATKTYVDTADALKLNLTGGTMSGAIAMGTNKITGVGNPTLAQDAATKDYVDDILGSATSAATSAAAAATSASNAATSASNAASSATASANSASAAAASYDAFDDRYLGDKASDPTLDNDGNALLTGALYFNTTSDVMKVYDGSAWNIAAISSASPTFTGTVTIPTADINGGTIDGTVIGGSTAAAGTFTTGQFNTSLNVDGTATMDGLVSVVSSSGATTVSASLYNNGAGANTKTGIDFYAANSKYATIAGGFGAALPEVDILVGSGTQLKAATFSGGGDISFYEDTGTTPKFFWDASAESLGVGTVSPTYTLQANSGAATTTVRLQTNAGVNPTLSFLRGATEAMYAEGTFYGGNVNYVQALTFSRAGTENFRFGDGGHFTVGSNYLAPIVRFSGSAPANSFYQDNSGNVGIGVVPSAWSSTFKVLQLANGTSLSNNGQTSYYQLGANNYFDGTNYRYLASNFAAIHRFSNLGAYEWLTASSGTAGNAISFTQAMTLDSSGNLLVGKTSTDNTTNGFVLDANGTLNVVRSSEYLMRLNRTTTDGEILRFEKDGTTVGSIGTSGGAVTIGKGITTLKYLDSLDTIHPNGTGSGSDGLTTLGWSNNRFKDLYLSGGVYLGGTVAANQLDDYEEGTWTPSFTGSTGNPTVSYSTQTGTYIKVGGLVTVSAFIITNTSSGGSGHLSVSGLPFAIGSGQDYGAVISFNYNWAAGESPHYAIAQSGTSQIILYKDATTNTISEPDDILASGNTYLRLTVTYFT
jgi:hypothetical protein